MWYRKNSVKWQFIFKNKLPNFLLIAVVISNVLLGCKKNINTTFCNQSTINNKSIDTLMYNIISKIENVTNSNNYKYNCKDDAGNTMDCIKIISHQNDTFVAVYHTFKNNIFYTNVATSSNLLDWHFQKQLGIKASQPTIYKTINNNYIVVWEQEPTNHLKIIWYTNFQNLINNTQLKSKEIGQTLSTYAEGTPNIYFANDTIIHIGFHYYNNGQTDKQAFGILKNITTWTTNIEYCLNDVFEPLNIKGNIGDRDAFLYKNQEFIIIEAQQNKNDFGSWKIFLYNKNYHKIIPIEIKTHLNSKSFANPTISILDYQNQTTLVVSLFIPSENSNPNESGSLVYYITL